MTAEVQTGTEAYADDTPLTYLFGTGAKVKIVAALLGENGTDLNVTDIARLAGVARSTVYDHIDELQELGIVEHTRNVGDSPMYRFDMENEVGEHVAKLEGVALRRLLENDGLLDG